MSNIKAVITFKSQADCEALSEFATTTGAELALAVPEIIYQTVSDIYRIVTSAPDYASANEFLNTIHRQAVVQNIEFVKCDLVDLDTFDAALKP